MTVICFICKQEIEGSKLQHSINKEKNTLHAVGFTLQKQREPPALKDHYCHPKCMVNIIRMQKMFCDKCNYQIAQCNICGEIDCLKAGWVCACGFVICGHCEDTDIDDQGTVNCRNCGTDKHWEEPERGKIYATLPYGNGLDELIKIELEKINNDTWDRNTVIDIICLPSYFT